MIFAAVSMLLQYLQEHLEETFTWWFLANLMVNVLLIAEQEKQVELWYDLYVKVLSLFDDNL